MGVKVTWACGELTMTDRVAGRRAQSQLYLSFLVTDGAGQAGFEGAFPVRVCIVHALLANRVMIVFTVRQHALSYRAQCTGLAATRHSAEEVVVVADTDGIIGVSAGSLQPHQASTLSARSALLCVTIILREGFTCKKERIGQRDGTYKQDGGNGSRKDEEITRGINSESNGINHVYCTFIRKEDTLIHWVLSDLCSRTRKALSSRRESKALCAHYDIDRDVFVQCWVNCFNLSRIHRGKCTYINTYTDAPVIKTLFTSYQAFTLEALGTVTAESLSHAGKSSISDMLQSDLC